MKFLRISLITIVLIFPGFSNFLLAQKGVITSKNIVGYQVSQIIPNIDILGHINDYDTSRVEVFFYEDLALYHLNYLHTITVDGKILIKDERRFHYFVYGKDSTYGYDIDENKTPSVRKAEVDSTFKFEWVKQTRLFEMFINGKPFLFKSENYRDSTVEYYKIRDKKDSIDIVECKVVFSPHFKNDQNISICRELDSLKHMKVIEFSFTTNPEYLKNFGIVKGEYFCKYQLKKLIPVLDEETKMGYFNKFKTR